MDYATLKKELYERFTIIPCKAVDEAYDLAYEYGHADGAQAVQNYFTDMLNIVRLALNPNA